MYVYRVTGWYNGGIEMIALTEWDDVLALVQVLEPDMYRGVLVENMMTRETVFSYADWDR